MDKHLIFLQLVITYSLFAGYASHVQVFHDAMNEIMEKTKVNGKKCIDFQEHQSSAHEAYIKFSFGSG